MKITLLIFVNVALILSVCGVALKTPEDLENDHENEEMPNIPVETCTAPLQGGVVKPVVGLLPNSDSDCGLFWLCRKSGDGTPASPQRFNCSDVNPEKPYYDAASCSCVATPDHCPVNNDIQNRWLCIRLLEEEPEVETCRGFGVTDKYYLSHFINYEDETSFWFCKTNPGNSEGGKAPPTHAVLFPCGHNLVYDAETCACGHPGDVSIEFNQHPMNRFKCAEEYIAPEDRETCQDDRGRYYEGLFPNVKDSNHFWECVVQNKSRVVSTAEVRSCEDDNLHFNIESCNCSTVTSDNNSNPDYRYHCSRPLDIEEEEEDICRDSEGNYHIGDIPNVQDCSKFWSCAHSSNPWVTEPTEQNCTAGTMFNVLSEVCGCDHPGSFQCADNLKPENKFRCAPNITIGYD